MSCSKTVKAPLLTFKQIVHVHLGLHELHEVREIALGHLQADSVRAPGRS